jgi:hypothetical protein
MVKWECVYCDVRVCESVRVKWECVYCDVRVYESVKVKYGL